MFVITKNIMKRPVSKQSSNGVPRYGINTKGGITYAAESIISKAHLTGQ
jgi:hypothetical protein